MICTPHEAVSSAPEDEANLVTGHDGSKLECGFV